MRSHMVSFIEITEIRAYPDILLNKFIQRLSKDLEDFIAEGNLRYRDGVEKMLQNLKKARDENPDLEIILISATPYEVFQREAELMGYSQYFGNNVVGAGWEGTVNKKEEIERFLEQRSDLKEGEYTMIGNGTGDMRTANATNAIAIFLSETPPPDNSVKIDIRLPSWYSTDTISNLFFSRDLFSVAVHAINIV